MTSKKRTTNIKKRRTTTRGERTIKHENNLDNDEDKSNEEPIYQNMLAQKGSLGRTCVSSRILFLLLRIRLHSGFLNLVPVMTYSFDNKSCGPTPRNDSVQTLKLYISNLTFVVNMRRNNVGA